MNIDLVKYSGRWYEILRIQNSFERGMEDVFAEYDLMSDGKLKVVNSGYRDGKFKSITGKAHSVDKLNTKLKVSFRWPFTGDYWVLDLDKDYSWSMVGSPCRKYLWILSRKPYLSQQVILNLERRALLLGFDTKKLTVTPQSRNINKV